MMLLGFFCLFILTGVVARSSEKVCSYQDVLNHLNLSRNNELFTMTRPVRDHRQATAVSLEILLYAILDVRETDQTFIPYVWAFMSWDNQFISWDPSEFCGIETVSVPTEVLWKPDITIEEMTEKDKATLSPFLTIFSNGKVLVQNDMVLVSTCRMHVYRFPFDTQSCNLSIKSILHSVEEIQLFYNSSSKEATEESKELMRTQYEWLFINMSVSSHMANSFGYNQTVITYTINMKRRSVLYIVNFILPILFFLCLDLASFLISENGGEKLSFKVTVLLAVTVLQLILNEILPASSNRIPLIAVYCIGVFALMMLSLLETIVVMYLIEKDSAPPGNEKKTDGSLREDKPGKFNVHSFDSGDFLPKGRKWNQCGSGCHKEETPAELMKIQVSSGHMSSASQDSDDLTAALKTLTQLLDSKREEVKPGYWSRKTKTINKVFFVFYIVTATCFLVFMFLYWNL